MKFIANNLFDALRAGEIEGWKNSNELSLKYGKGYEGIYEFMTVILLDKGSRAKKMLQDGNVNNKVNIQQKHVAECSWNRTEWILDF